MTAENIYLIRHKNKNQRFHVVVLAGSAWHCLLKLPLHVEDNADDRTGKAGAFPT